MKALEVKNLCKNFGSVQAVKNASFNVSEGVIFGLIGRNGAGKTTTIRMMMNIYEPDSGEVILRGKKVGQEFRNSVGYLPEERGLYKKMKVIDILLFFAEIKGKKGADIRKKALEYLDRFSLADRKNAKIEELSKGNQQKIQFISTILHEPEFIILDEPFTGLDPININILKDIILQLKEKGKIIILSTHLMDFAERMCDEIALINKGEIILKGALEKIKEEEGNKNLSISFVSGESSFIKDLPYVEYVKNYGNHRVSVGMKERGQSNNLLREFIDRDIVIDDFSANKISLQEIFVKYAGAEQEEVKEVQYV